MAREMLTTLEQKIDPRWTALLVIDMLNDFCAEGNFLITPCTELLRSYLRIRFLQVGQSNFLCCLFEVTLAHLNQTHHLHPL